MPLLDRYDGLGAIILLTDNGQLVANEGPFVSQSAPEFSALNLWVQHWRHISEPVLDSATVANAQVRLWWTNHHLKRAIDSTAIFRDGVLRYLLPGSATSLSDPAPAPGSYTYALKHFTPTTVPSEGDIEQPNSAQSNALTVNVPPTSMTALIVGADNLPDTTGGNNPSIGLYYWGARASGGVGNPYHYQWFYQRVHGLIEPQVNSDWPTYARYVFQESQGFAFRLIVSIWDAQGFRRDSADMMLVYVDATAGSGFPASVAAAASLPTRPTLALRMPDGSCQVVPEDRAARQRLFWIIWRAGIDFRRCVATVSSP